MSSDAAHVILENARRLLRTAAAAANSSRPKAQIGSNYSKFGDAIAAKARLAHTRRGSFIFPIVLPIPTPFARRDGQLDISVSSPEPAERRVTLTLATALQGILDVAVRPERSPTTGDLDELIEHGVSRELVMAVRVLATSSGTGKLDTGFTWAGALERPGGVPDHVEVPADAAPRLDVIATRLSATERAPSDSISGLVVAMRESPDGNPGEINIHAIRNGRQAEVIVLVTPQQIRDAHDWATDRRAVIAYGAVESQAGQRPLMRKPRALQPVDETYLDSGGH